MKRCLLLICLALCAWGCSSVDEEAPMLLRARVDGLNKEAFQNRYQDPMRGVALADSACRLIQDSLPQYGNGLLRAWNNGAYCCFMLSDFDGAEQRLAEIDSFAGKAQNYEVEKMISQLLRARMMQRHCNIAESYQLLYEAGKSKVLRRKGGGYLYDFARMEYYITSLTLNYHYRNGALGNVDGLLQKIEEERAALKCDYAQDMALNYSMAHSYYKLCDSDSYSQPDMLRRSLQCCAENLDILKDPHRYSDYHLANVLQMLAFIGADTNIAVSSWQTCDAELGGIWERLLQDFDIDLYAAADPTAVCFDISAHMFWESQDPYQRLGAVVASADYALAVGDTALAQHYYHWVLGDSLRQNPYSPKFEAMLFAGLIHSGYSENGDTVAAWFDREMTIQNFIKRNEKADFVLQNSLRESRRFNQSLMVASGLIFVVVVVLAVLLLTLRRKSRQLKQETLRLQQMQERNVEQMANLETCLSVMRHDIGPFISYLRNKDLPQELRDEVLGQLLRTFDNIKSWTHLSIPTGLHFQAGEVKVEELFDEVRGNCVAPLHGGVELHFLPTSLTVWGDRQLLTILLRNLVNNALQHTQQGFVQVGAQAGDDHFVELYVRDSGCGMDDEQIDALFRSDKKISTRETSPEGYGSGFGLILCRHIVKQHDDNTRRGCRIWVESKVGFGSVFHVMVPQYTQDSLKV